MTRPLVTVLLTSYNRAAMLCEAVTSVLCQTMDDFELIVLDDNSPRGSGVAKVLAKLRDERAWLLQSRIPDGRRSEHARYAVMINRGIRLARGKYLAYLCDDDLYLPEHLAALTGFLEANRQATVAYGPQIVRFPGKPDLLRPADNVLRDAAFLVDHCSVVHRRQIAGLDGGWDESADGQELGDAKFWRKLTDAGHQFYPVPGEPLTIHRHHPGTLTGPLSDDQIRADRMAGRLV